LNGEVNVQVGLPVSVKDVKPRLCSSSNDHQEQQVSGHETSKSALLGVGVSPFLSWGSTTVRRCKVSQVRLVLRRVSPPNGSTQGVLILGYRIWSAGLGIFIKLGVATLRTYASPLRGSANILATIPGLWDDQRWDHVDRAVVVATSLLADPQDAVKGNDKGRAASMVRTKGRSFATERGA